MLKTRKWIDQRGGDKARFIKRCPGKWFVYIQLQLEMSRVHWCFLEVISQLPRDTGSRRKIGWTCHEDWQKDMKICFVPRWLLGRWRISRCRGVFYGSLRWSYPISGTSMLPWSCWANVFFDISKLNVYEFCSSVVFPLYMPLCVCVCREWKLMNVFNCLWWKEKGKH